MSDIDETLSALETICNRATDSPWRIDLTLNKDETVNSVNITKGPYDIAYTVAGNIEPGPDRDMQKEWDAEFIAASRTFLPAMADALTAVLDLLDECESFYGSVLFDGTPMPTIVGTDEVRRAIEKHLTKEGA